MWRGVGGLVEGRAYAELWIRRPAGRRRADRAARAGAARGSRRGAYREVRDVSRRARRLAARQFDRRRRNSATTTATTSASTGGRLGARGTRRSARPVALRRWRAKTSRVSRSARRRPSGPFRPNPALGGPRARHRDPRRLRAPAQGFAVRRDRAFDVSLEAGRVGRRRDLPAASPARRMCWSRSARTRVLVRAQGGVASADLPAHRAFVLGGRGTLLGDDFRAWGGTRGGTAARRVARARAVPESLVRSRGAHAALDHARALRGGGWSRPSGGDDAVARHARCARHHGPRTRMARRVPARGGLRRAERPRALGVRRDTGLLDVIASSPGMRPPARFHCSRSYARNPLPRRVAGPIARGAHARAPGAAAGQGRAGEDVVGDGRPGEAGDRRRDPREARQPVSGCASPT